MLQTKLKNNKFGDAPKYIKTEETMKVGELGVVGDKSKCCIATTFKNFVVFTSGDTYKRENYTNVIVYNNDTKDIWKVGNVGPLLFGGNFDVKLNKTILAINYDSDINEFYYGDNDTLKVFSMESKEILHLCLLSCMI